MARYLTYEEYQELGGSLPETAYNLAELKARKRVDALTQGRVANMAEVPFEVKAAMMEIMAVDARFSAAAQAGAPVVASFTTDGYSESYGSVESRTTSMEKQLTASIMTLLAGVTDDHGVPLLYAGVATCGGGGWP